MRGDYDFSEDEFKQRSRTYNLEQVARCRNLMNQYDNRLLCDWAELPGVGAPTMVLLREQGILRDTRFLAPERDTKVFKGLCKKYGESSEHHQFFAEDLEMWIRGAGTEGVGVLNWDSLNIARGEVYEDALDLFWEFAMTQARRLGNFALIINAGLDRGGTLKTFQESLARRGHHMDEAHLELPGVRYGHGRDTRRSHRINYAVLFGPVKTSGRRKHGEET